MPATAHATLTNRPLIDTGYRHNEVHKKIRRTPKIIPIPRDTPAIRQLAVLHQTRNEAAITPDLRDAFLKVWRTTRALALASVMPGPVGRRATPSNTTPTSARVDAAPARPAHPLGTRPRNPRRA